MTSNARHNTDTEEGVEPLYIFLGRFSPFDALSEDLRDVASAADLLAVDAGETILVEDGPPARHLYIVRSGSVALVHDGESVDVLGVGEVFGHPSLLTGLAPSFTVRAHEA